MRNALRTVLAVTLIALAGASACSQGGGGGGGKSSAGDVCHKAETCQVLTGTTAAACAALIDKALDAMASGARADAQKALDACTATAACADLNSCIDGALQGGSGGSGGSGGTSAGGSGGSSAGGSGGSSSGGSGGSPAGGASGSSGGSGGSSSGGSSGAASGGSSGGGSGGSPAGGSSAGGRGGAGGTSAGGSSGSPSGGGGSSAGGSGGATGGAASGGNATGGAATGGSSASAPELVTSAQNAYWTTTGQVTKVTSGTADVNIDKNTTYQRWDGFGGCFNEMGWDALSVVTAADVANAMKLLFDPKDGANFVYGRLPMGASDYSMSWYTLDDLPSGTANDYNMDKFSIDRDRQKLIPFIKEALKVKADLHLWASPWVVPSWMMDSSSNMKSDAQTQGAHALYMAKFVQEYAKEGLKIEAIHPQNEPGYGRVHWTQAELITFMKTYLAPKLAEQNLTTEVWCGTMSKADNGGYDQAIALATAADADAMKVVKGFGVQWNLHDAVATLAQKAPVMQTEHRCGNYNFASPYWDQSRYSSTQAQNDHLYGEESWQIIRDWIVAGVNSYSTWNMVLDTVGKSLDGWPQDALLVVDRSAKKLIVTPAYYVFRHLSYYIAVGATRVAITASTDAYKGANQTTYGSKKATYDAVNALAFKNPDGSIIVQLYNKGASTKTTVGIGSALSQTLYQFDVPGHGWATLRVPQ